MESPCRVLTRPRRSASHLVEHLGHRLGSTRGIRCGVVAAAMLAAAVVSAPSLGQAGGQAGGSPTILPPTIRETGKPPVVRMYLITALIGGLVIGANLIPSKRGHQD